jgi:hypothetical protein
MLCPKCGKEMKMGYGLAGGGMGVYFMCETEGCETFEKVQDEESDAEYKGEMRND